MNFRKWLLQPLLKRIAMNQQELAQALNGLGRQLDKAKTEINQAISDLNQALANAGNSTPEVDDALRNLTTKAQALDDMNTDVVVDPSTDPVPNTGESQTGGGTGGETGGDATNQNA